MERTSRLGFFFPQTEQPPFTFSEKRINEQQPLSQVLCLNTERIEIVFGQ